MITIDLESVELLETAAGRRVSFPFHSGTGTASTASVLFELDPGSALATHTDSAEEVLLVLEGEGEAHVGEQQVRLGAGQLAVVPAMAPHGIRNIGETNLRVLGFFSSSTVVATFDEPLGPDGERISVIGTRAPILAHVAEASTLPA